MAVMRTPEFSKKISLWLAFLWMLSPVLAKADCMNVVLGAVGKIYCLEVADTEQTRKTGLQGRRSLSEDGGMLFVFSDDAPRVMWMKDTVITLDILFLDNDGAVRSMASRVSPSKIKLYSSARYVIELAGGTVEKLDLWPGDRVLLSPQSAQIDAP